MTPARERLAAVAVLVLLGGSVVLASTRTFASARIDGVAAPLTAAGSAAVPALAPLGIVVLAAAAALAIAGRVARGVLGAVLVLLGAGVVALAAGAASDPASSVRGTVRAATGVTDVAPLLRGVEGTGWPFLAVVAGVLVGLVGLLVLVRLRAWPTGGRRFRQQPVAAVSTDPIDEWDALSRGADPTDPR